MRKKSGNKDLSILKAAIKLIARQGYHGTTVQEIANEAGIGVGSVYSYYASKEEILDTIFTDMWNDLISDLERISESSAGYDLKIEELLNSVKGDLQTTDNPESVQTENEES